MSGRRRTERRSRSRSRSGIGQALAAAIRVNRVSNDIDKAAPGTLGDLFSLFLGMCAPKQGIDVKTQDGKDMHLSAEDLRALGNFRLGRLAARYGDEWKRGGK